MTLPPDWSEWHESRAAGKESMFTRVRECAEEKRTLALACRDCGWKPDAPIVLGCSVGMFCPSCRVRTAQRFRVDFERKRLGLVTAARRAGLMNRFRRRSVGGRFGEKLVTLTLPHWGSPMQRVQQIKDTWARFWRLVSDEVRPRLASLAAGIRKLDPERFDDRTGELIEYRTKGGRAAKRAREAAVLPASELSLWDLVSYLWVFEWTAGSDELGHPHLHVWIFSPYLSAARLQELWARAFADTIGGRVERVGVVRSDRKQVEAAAVVVEREDGAGDERVAVPLIDVRTAHDIERDGGSVANELVKYLTKDWETTADGVKRAAPEVFAQVYNAIDGQRMRQSSSGLAKWAVPKIAICPCCGYENHRGHWAFVAVEWQIGKMLKRPPAPSSSPVFPTPATGPPPVATREQELSAEYWARRDAEWSDSFELRILRSRWQRMLAGEPLESSSSGVTRRDDLLAYYHRARTERGFGAF